MTPPARGRRSSRVRATYTKDELSEQWAFLDSLVERQAATLLAGVQDQEEEELVAAVTPAQDDTLVRELETLRTRVRVLEQQTTHSTELDFLRRRVELLEGERRELLQRLRDTQRVSAAEHARHAHRLGSWFRRR